MRRLLLSSVGEVVVVAANGEPDFETLRRWKRYDFDVRIRVTMFSEGALRSVYGRGNDLSTGGMAAFVAAELNKGDNIELDLTLPYSSQPMKLKAIVCNRSGYKYGVEFVDILPEQRKIIERTCSALEFIR
jgi:c-di-GMP-binding flagellar brake protein YcgR